MGVTLENRIIFPFLQEETEGTEIFLILIFSVFSVGSCSTPTFEQSRNRWSKSAGDSRAQMGYAPFNI